MIKMKSKVKFSKTKRYFEKILHLFGIGYFDGYGRRGVDALSKATPVDSGETASKWSYKIENNKERIAIHFYNDNNVDGVNIAIILQYGHVSRSGGWVEGTDYINPAIRPLFKEMCDKMWAEVTS